MPTNLTYYIRCTQFMRNRYKCGRRELSNGKRRKRRKQIKEISKRMDKSVCKG